MDKTKLQNLLGDFFCVAEESQNCYKIKTQCKYFGKEKIVLTLTCYDDKYFITDDKNTLKTMNEIYNLQSIDVKSCISNIIKLYSYSITSGNLTSCAVTEKTIAKELVTFLMCQNQMLNMFIFFDKPE